MIAPGTSFPPEIRGGIEFFKVEDKTAGAWWEEAQCARCGSCVDHVTCWDCGGDGHHGSACWDDLCHGQEQCIHGDDAVLVCETCRGEGGSLHCTQTRDWCLAHPMAGREQVESTAFSDARAWDD